MEHRRWSAERVPRGWRLGSRDDDRRLHPDLMPFDALGASTPETDRDAARVIPEVLALAGRAIERGA